MPSLVIWVLKQLRSKCGLGEVYFSLVKRYGKYLLIVVVNSTWKLEGVGGHDILL